MEQKAGLLSSFYCIDRLQEGLKFIIARCQYPYSLHAMIVHECEGIDKGWNLPEHGGLCALFRNFPLCTMQNQTWILAVIRGNPWSSFFGTMRYSGIQLLHSVALILLTPHFDKVES